MEQKIVYYNLNALLVIGTLGFGTPWATPSARFKRHANKLAKQGWYVHSYTKAGPFSRAQAIYRRDEEERREHIEQQKGRANMAELTDETEQACRCAQDQAAHDIPYVTVGEARPYQYHYPSGRLYVEVDLQHHDPDRGAAVALYRVWKRTDGSMAATKVDIRGAE